MRRSVVRCGSRARDVQWKFLANRNVAGKWSKSRLLQEANLSECPTARPVPQRLPVCRG